MHESPARQLMEEVPEVAQQIAEHVAADALSEREAAVQRPTRRRLSGFTLVAVNRDTAARL
jgi:hypothetical protein